MLNRNMLIKQKLIPMTKAHKIAKILTKMKQIFKILKKNINKT